MRHALITLVRQRWRIRFGERPCVNKILDLCETKNWLCSYGIAPVLIIAIKEVNFTHPIFARRCGCAYSPTSNI